MATAHPTLTRSADPADRSASSTTRTEKGISLARGPALILGTILLAAGLYFLYKAHSFPRFSNFPNGTAHKNGNFFFGIFGANGWTGELTAVAGGLLLFGAAHHVLAKTMSLIVGIALGAAAIIAVISGNVLGMAATNGWTELGWGICAVILLFNSMIPRRTREVEVAAAGGAAGGAAVHERRRERRDVAAEEAGVGAGAGAGMGRNRGAMVNEPAMANNQGAMVNEPAMANNRGAMVNEPATANNQGAMANGEGAMTDEPLMARDDGAMNNGGGSRMGADGMGADETQMLENRPRRFERSGEMDNMNGATDGQATTGTRRSGGLLSNLLHRD